MLEIGPGPGLMTCLLAHRARSVTAVELDRRLEPVLSAMLEGCENARVLYADALKTDLAALTAPGARVVANLPYYITADVVTRLLLRGAGYESIAVMVQKEAAERMTSLPGDKQWCHLAALVRYFGEPRILEEIPPEAFEPSPHVVSAFLRIDLYDERPVRPNDEALFLRVLAAAFAMRRKTLQNNLRAAFSLSAEAAAQAIERAGLPERVARRSRAAGGPCPPRRRAGGNTGCINASPPWLYRPAAVLTKCVDDFYPAADMAVEGIQFLRRHPQFPVTGSADGVDFKLPGIGVVEFKARDISSMIVVAGGVPARGDLDGVLLLKDGIEDRLPRQTAAGRRYSRLRV